MNYLEGLNPAQREAVLAPNAPTLVVAGAGAGKTRTLTARIRRLVETGLQPEAVLAITFTNKAAREMADRAAALAPDAFAPDARHRETALSRLARPFIGTFHSLCLAILRERHARLDLPRRFAILDRTDSRRLMRAAVRDAGYDPKLFDPDRLLARMSRLKGENLRAGEALEAAGDARFNPARKALIESWRAYDALRAGEHALDFDDLLLETARLLASDREIRAHYGARFAAVLVDEYQDTNRVQYDLVRLLAETHRGIFAVGDGDQAIYGWRGAQTANMRDFLRDFPEARTILLEENYRSTKNILAAANTVIAKNEYRAPKTLFTKNPEGERIALRFARDEADEARWVASEAARTIARGASPDEIAVLYRANYQSRALEQAFLEARIPCQVLGTRFFDRREVRDILAFIRAALGGIAAARAGDLERIVNVPPRGIGKTTLLKVLSGRTAELAPAMRRRVADFENLLGRIRDQAATLPPSQLVKYIAIETGMERKYAEGDLPDDEERLGNIRELANIAASSDDLPRPDGLEWLLEHAALAGEQDTLLARKRGVKLMTVHAAKGLEFDEVFITGLEEGLFPHERSGLETPEEAEEERRLFYVALTRARRRVLLSAAHTRLVFGSRQITGPSEFLSDIDESLLAYVDDGSPTPDGWREAPPKQKVVYLE